MCRWPQITWRRKKDQCSFEPSVLIFYANDMCLEQEYGPCKETDTKTRHNLITVVRLYSLGLLIFTHPCICPPPPSRPTLGSDVTLYQYTSLAANGALAHHLQCRTACKIQNGRQGAPKWRTGSGKVSTPRFLGILSNFR